MLPPDRPLTAGFLRAAVAGLLLLAIAPGVPPVGWRLRTVVLGVLNIGAFFPLLFISAYRLPGGLAAVVGSLQPLIIAALTATLGWRQPPRRQVALAVGAAGVLIILRPGAAGASLPGTARSRARHGSSSSGAW